MEGAMRALRRGIEKNPNDAWFWKVLVGDTQLVQRNYTSAIESFTKAGNISPTDSQIWLKLGEANTLIGDLESAIRVLKDAIANFPNVLRLRTALGEAYKAIGNAKAADEVCLEAAKKFPSIRTQAQIAPGVSRSVIMALHTGG
jgi:predicted Zn-dependent protease